MVRVGPSTQVGNSDTNATDFSAGIINGIQINKFFSLGIGAEATTFVYENVGTPSRVMIYPVFLDARFYEARLTVQPMFGFQMGYAWVGNKKDGSGNSHVRIEPETGAGGLHFGFNAGVRFPVTKGLAIMLDGGFTIQKLHDTKPAVPVDQVAAIRGNIGVSWNFGAAKK